MNISEQQANDLIISETYVFQDSDSSTRAIVSFKNGLTFSGESFATEKDSLDHENEKAKAKSLAISKMISFEA